MRSGVSLLPGAFIRPSGPVCGENHSTADKIPAALLRQEMNRNSRNRDGMARLAARIRLTGRSPAIEHFRSRLFTADHVAQIFGDQLAPVADNVARRLDLSVAWSITRQKESDLRLASAEEGQALTNIAEKAADLYAALGCGTVIPDVSSTLQFDSYPKLTYRPSNSLDFLHGSASFLEFRGARPDGLELTDDEYRTLGEFRDAPLTKDDLAAALDDKYTARCAAAVAIRMLPDALSALVDVARHSAAKRKSQARRGDRRNEFAPLFFSLFILAFEAATGQLPEGRVKGLSPNLETVEAVRRTVTIAAGRLRDVFDGDDGETRRFASLLLEIAKKRDRTIADDVEAAVRAHRAFTRSWQEAAER